MLKADQKPLEYLFFTVGINSGLRVGDMLTLTIGDLWELEGKPRKEFSMRAQKTGSLAITQINPAIQEAMSFASTQVPLHDLDAPLFPFHRRTASRWVKTWCKAAGIDRGTYSAHSLRKTFAYQHWLEQNKTDEALVIVSKALGHKSTGTTMDYLGIRRQQIREWQMELSL